MGRVLRDLRGLGWKTLAPMGGYALYLAFSFTVFHSFTLFVAADALDPVSQTLFLVTVIVSRVAVFAAMAAHALRAPSTSPLISVILSCSTALCGFFVCGMALQFLGDVELARMLPWLLFGGLCLGAGDALMQLLWARLCKGFSLQVTYTFVLVGNLGSLAVYLAITLLPVPLIVPATAVLFVGASLCVLRALRVRPPLASEFSAPVLHGAIGRLWRPVLGTAVFCFMSGLMMQISGQQELSLATVQQTSIVSSAVVIVVLLVPVLAISKPINVERVFKTALPLSAGGFLLLPILGNAAGGIVNAFAQLGSMVAGIILWCLLADMARDTKLPTALVFSLALGCTNLSQLAGVLVGFFWADNLAQGGVALTAVALVSLYLLSMLSLVVFRERTSADEDEALRMPSGEMAWGKPEARGAMGAAADCADGGIGAPDSSRLEERCRRIAEERLLTPREGDIFELLAQGRTVHGISEKLCVSENTVKSHIKSIYQKLAIHTRSELIELVNDEPAPGAPS